MKAQSMQRYAPAIGTLGCLVLVWEAAVRVWGISSNILPAPSLIMSYVVEYRYVLLEHSAQTLLEALLGLSVASLLGIVVALALDSSAVVRKAVYPLLVSSQTIPIVALAPLFLVFLGYGILPKIIIVVLYCFFPIAIATSSGLAAVDASYINVLRTMRASSWQIVRLVKLPSALPSFFAGLKIAVAYSMTGAIVGEYVGAVKGLGVLIQTAANTHSTPLVFAAIIATTVVSLILFGITAYIERCALPWQTAIKNRHRYTN